MIKYLMITNFEKRNIMLVASECRAKARENLRGKWGVAVGSGFVATLLGGGIFSGGYSSNAGSQYSENITNSSGLSETLGPESAAIIMGFIAIVFMFLALYSLALFVVSGPMKLGYARFNLNLAEERPVKFSDIFSGFSLFGKAFLLNLISSLIQLAFVLIPVIILIVTVVMWAFTGIDSSSFIWAIMLVVLVLLIPSIIAAYRMILSTYLLASNSNLSAFDSIKLSNRLMKGNCWRLFCLGFSFIGWALLCVLTLGIGLLWLIPYQEATLAVFYKDILRDDMLRNQSETRTITNDASSAYSEQATTPLVVNIENQVDQNENLSEVSSTDQSE